MLTSRNHVFSVFALLLLVLATGIFAAEEEVVDCINYTGDEPDYRCRYFRIEESKGVELFVVADGEDLDPANALPNTDFLVYAPFASNDSLVAYQKDGDTNIDVEHMMRVNSGASGRVTFGVKGLYPYANVPMGTVENETAEPKIIRVYNFYAPALQYLVDGEVVTKDTKLKVEVGDTLRVDVRALISMGPLSGRLDSSLTKTFYFSAEDESKNLEFLSMAGESLKLSTGAIRLDILNGKASFQVIATKSVTDGSTFALNGFPDKASSKDNPDYIVKNPFPGNLQFVNPDMPSLDSASIFDTDGDGIGDSIATWFSGNMDSASVKNFFYSWPTESKFKEATEEKKFKGGFGLPGVDVAIQGEDAAGAVKAYLCTSVGNRCDTLRTKLNDRIGAVIREATLIKGDAGHDTLVVRFNKEVDKSWTEGEGLMLNGKSIYVETVSAKGLVWRFSVVEKVVSIGDKVKIQTLCEKKECPDGIITAADGIPTAKNNQEVVVKNSGRIYADDENNGFYDRDGDGRMDSVSIGFDMPISRDDLKNVEITFYWLDNEGKVLSFTPKADDLDLSSDGTIVGYGLDPKKLDVMEMLTSIDSTRSHDGKETYGYAVVRNRVVVDGKESFEETMCTMNDYMPPVISSTFLSPESFQEMEPDKFSVTFTEPVDHDNFKLTDDCLSFYVDGSWVTYNLSMAEWSDDGRKVTFYMEAGDDLSERMNPADSVRFGNFTSGIVDKNGNLVSELSPAVMVQGDPRVIMKTTSFADLNRAEELSGRVKPFTIDHVKDKLDKDNQGSLGVLMDVGFSTIMKADSTGEAKPDLKKIGLTWELRVFSNLGAYVGSASGDIACDDSFFDGNCLENPDKLYVRWNMRADNGRKVGVGVYLVKFIVKVYGAQEDFKVERIFRWGISAASGKRN